MKEGTKGRKERETEGRKNGRKEGRKEGGEEGRKEGTNPYRTALHHCVCERLKWAARPCLSNSVRPQAAKLMSPESRTATWKCLLPSWCISWYTTTLRRSGPASSDLGLPPAGFRNGCPQASRTQASTSSGVSAFTSFKPPLWRRSASTRAKVSKYTLVAWSDSRRSGPRLTNHGGCFWTSLRRPQATALATNIVGTTGLNRMA